MQEKKNNFKWVLIFIIAILALASIFVCFHGALDLGEEKTLTGVLITDPILRAKAFSHDFATFSINTKSGIKSFVVEGDYNAARTCSSFKKGDLVKLNHCKFTDKENYFRVKYKNIELLKNENAE